MTKLEKLYSIIENSREVGVRLNEDVLRQVEELEEGIIKGEILPLGACGRISSWGANPCSLEP